MLTEKQQKIEYAELHQQLGLSMWRGLITLSKITLSKTRKMIKKLTKYHNIMIITKTDPIVKNGIKSLSQKSKVEIRVLMKWYYVWISEKSLCRIYLWHFLTLSNRGKNTIGSFEFQSSSWILDFNEVIFNEVIEFWRSDLMQFLTKWSAFRRSD